jgi:hypothetical protein
VSAGRIAPGAVTDGKLGDGSVTNGKLGDGSVTSTKLGDGSVTNFKLASGVVTHSKLGINSIDGGDVAPDSLSLADLVGADRTGTISLNRPAGTCGTLSLNVPGAQVGQVALYSFTGNTAVPTSITFGGSKVTAAGSIAVRYCNVSGSSVSVSNLGIRVVTFD